MSYYVYSASQRGIVVTGSVGGDVVTPVSVVIDDAFDPLDVGGSGQFTAMVYYSDSSQVSSADVPTIVDWSSSDESIVTVDDSGNYTAVSAGSATITATLVEDVDMYDSNILEIVEATEDYDRFSIVVGEGYYGSDTLTSVGVFLYSPDHPEYTDTYGEFSSESWPVGEPVESVRDKSQFIWRRRSSDVVTYFSSNVKWPRWRDWDGMTVTFTHGSDSISQNLTFGNFYIATSEEGISVHEFLSARVGQSVDVVLTKYTPTAMEKAVAHTRSMEIR